MTATNRNDMPNLPATVSHQLPNKKHELFARAVANGETYTRAYELAGYNPSTANASTLANKEDVRERIAVLREEAEDRKIRFQIELRKANLDPSAPEEKSRQIAEWNVQTILGLYYENARLAQMAGQYSTAKESLDAISKITGLLDNNSGNKNDKPDRPQVNIGIYQDAARQLADGGGVSFEGSDNPLAPTIPSAASSRRK